MQSSFIQKKINGWLLRQTSTAGVRRVASLGGAIASEIGNVRNENQDRAVIVRGTDRQGKGYVVLVVADGIGGMQDGTKCASLGIAAFISELSLASKISSKKPIDWMRRAMHFANKTVYHNFKGRGGTTFVAVLLRLGEKPIWVSAGDSRLYVFGLKGIKQISIDDTIAGQLGKIGTVPAEHSKIIQYVGMSQDFTPHVETLDCYGEQALLLTTDGVHFLADNPNWFSNIIQHSSSVGTAAKRLIDLANWCGGPDNATIAIITLPVILEDLTLEDDYSLEIWDSFGELQLHIPSHNLLSNNESNAENKNKKSLNVNKLDVAANISSKNKRKPKVKSKTKTTSKKSSSRKKKVNQKASNDEKNIQLDIKFSPKTE